MMTILMIQAMAKQYRTPFFQKLHDGLEEHGIRLRVVYSNADSHEAAKGDNVDLPLEFSRKVNAHWMFGSRLLYQHVISEVKAADVIVVEQANKHLINYLLLLLSALKLKKVAYWGHGRNHQGERGLSEWLKRHMLRHADWWFAYTEATARYLTACGVSPEKVTTVQNSIDTAEFQRQLQSISHAEVCVASQQLGINPTDTVGLYCGSLDNAKEIPLLLDAAKQVKHNVSKFHLIIAGAGRDRAFVEHATEPWIHYVGPRFGRGKAVLFRLSQAVLMPAAVGLGILDAFAAGLPLVTTETPSHGPEIDYLEKGVNGLMTGHSAEEYARGILAVLSDTELMARLRQGAAASAGRYSIDEMVTNFRIGIRLCLNS